MSGDLSFGEDIGGGEAAHARKLGSFAERKKTSSVRRGGEFVQHALLHLGLRNAQAAGDGVRSVSFIACDFQVPDETPYFLPL